jgi:hypothetical protein
MQKNKRETHEGTCVYQSIGVCGGSIELVKRKRETPEGTCVGQCIGIGQFGSIELDGSIELNGSIQPNGGRLLLVENWGVISGDTIGDAGQQRANVELDGGSLAGLDMMVSRDGFGMVVIDDLSLDRRYSAIIGTDCRHWY